LRHALDEAFVSMSRRSQSMVEKQLTIIDELESVEEDPEQLRNLFRLDHLAARMRRYNDNLLVLAGSTVRTRSNTPVPIADVFRAATSEMEQYERVRLQPVGSAAVGGQVAGGLIHLLAELLDNAAMYSPPTSPILLTAEFAQDGGLHLEVTDSGVGIPPAELAELNSRLATPGTIDTQIPSRMGLFVVGRLAHRGGFEVRLSPRPTGAGTVAEVLVPVHHVVGADGAPASGSAAAPAPERPGAAAFPPQSSDHPFPGIPSPAGPPQPAPSWPPAAAAAPPAPAVPAAPAAPPVPSQDPGGGLPSRVPGAALSAGPLSDNPAAEQPASQFDAFGIGSSPAPPEEPSTATALWAQRSRPGDDEPEVGGTTAGSGPFGMPADSSVADPFGIGAFNGGSVASPPDIPSSPGPGEADSSFAGPSSGSLPFTAPPPEQEQPHRPPFGGDQDPAPWLRDLRSMPPDDPWAGHPRQQQDPFGGPEHPGPPEPLFGQALGSPGDVGGVTPPVDQMTPLTGDLPWQDINKAATPNPQIPSSTWQPSGDGRPSFDPGPSAMEQAAHDAVSHQYRPADPHAPMIGNLDDVPPDMSGTPIFDSISVWFHDEAAPATPPAYGPPAESAAFDAPTAPPAYGAPPAPAAFGAPPEPPTYGAPQAPAAYGAPPEPPAYQMPAMPRPPAVPQPPVADLRDPYPESPAGPPSDVDSRWADLGDQQWMATNARAAAQPEVAGDTNAGLPRRQPGANLLPSANAAAPTSTPSVPAPFRRADADTVRGRLGSYQRGVSSARRSRQIPTGGTAAGLFTATRTSTEETGHSPENHGGQE
jgi:anti-sigma regulatory factor (Ser/Thr protein kinase)